MHDQDPEAGAVASIVQRIRRDLETACATATATATGEDEGKDSFCASASVICEDRSWEIDSYHLANAMYGLQSLCATSPRKPPDCVLSVLHSLTTLLRASSDFRLTPAAVGNAFYGLQVRCLGRGGEGSCCSCCVQLGRVVSTC